MKYIALNFRNFVLILLGIHQGGKSPILLLGSIWRRAFQVYDVSAMGIYAQYILFILLPQ